MGEHVAAYAGRASHSLARGWFFRGREHARGRRRRHAQDLRPGNRRAPAHRRVDRCRLLPAQQGRRRLHRRHPPAQRHGRAAHGPRHGRLYPGHHHPLQPHARPLHALDRGHGPRRHRHADQGGQEAQERGHLAPGDRPREVHRRVLGLEARVRRHHHQADPPHGLLGGLLRRALHDGPRVRQGRAQGLLRLVPRRPHLPWQAHRQLVPLLHHGHLRRRGRVQGREGPPPTSTSTPASARAS